MHRSSESIAALAAALAKAQMLLTNPEKSLTATVGSDANAIGGSVTMGSAGGCTLIITVNGANGSTARHHWGGFMSDTSSGQTYIPVWGPAAWSTTTVTFNVPAAVNNGDVLYVDNLKAL